MKSPRLLAICLTTLLLVNGCIFYSTDKTEVGVRTRKIALIGEKGVEAKVYAPGSTYFFLPYINDWHTFDTKIEILDMTIDATQGDRKTRDDLLFKSIDGNDISLDVIISYRIDPQKAPYILQFVATNNQILRDRIVRTIARSKPRDIFGELTTEEFYIAENRQRQEQKAKSVLQDMLGPMGVIVDEVLTKDYRFNPEYQKAIEARKIADQQAEKNKSAQRAATEEYLRKLEEAKGEVNKMVAEADGEYEKAKIEADAYYELQQRLAEAIRAEAVAEAQGIQEMNDALAGTGGEALVKLKIAEALQNKKIMLLPVSEGGLNLKTTDVNQLIQMMGIQSLANKAKPPTAPPKPASDVQP